MSSAGQAGAGGTGRQTRNRHRHPGRRRLARRARLYQGACAVCHEVGGAPLFGSRPSLALNSNLHSAVPDNLIQVILHGITSPVSSDLGYMPAFKNSLTDGQLAELAAYLRQQFAPESRHGTASDAAIAANPAGHFTLKSCHAPPDPTGCAVPERLEFPP